MGRGRSSGVPLFRGLLKQAGIEAVCSGRQDFSRALPSCYFLSSPKVLANEMMNLPREV